MSAATQAPYDADIRHFLELRDLDAATLRGIVDLAARVKVMQRGRTRPLHPARPLEGRTLGLLLSKPSTRTRLSFEVGMRQLGGSVALMPPGDMQLGRGETLADTARVLSRFLDAVVVRSGDTNHVAELARWSTIPIINGLTPRSHPVQILADILTFEEHRGPIAGQRIAWVGDGNNVATSWIEAAARFGFTLALATPEAMAPDAETLAWARAQGADVEVTHDAREAVQGAACVVTDTWVSMSDVPTPGRLQALVPYRVTRDLMNNAASSALFMHCLPAHVGDEVSEDVFEGPQSVVFDEAENRLHAQKGLLLWSLGGAGWRRFGAEPA